MQLSQDAEGVCNRREHQQMLYTMVLTPGIYFFGRRGLPGGPL